MALPSAQTQGRNGGPGRMGGQEEKQLPTPTPGQEGSSVGGQNWGHRSGTANYPDVLVPPTSVNPSQHAGVRPRNPATAGCPKNSSCG